jgi:hypothetical protein
LLDDPGRVIPEEERNFYRKEAERVAGEAGCHMPQAFRRWVALTARLQDPAQAAALNEETRSAWEDARRALRRAAGLSSSGDSV